MQVSNLGSIKDNVDLTLDRDFMRNQTSHEILSEVRKKKSREVIQDLTSSKADKRKKVMYASKDLEPNKPSRYVILKEDGTKLLLESTKFNQMDDTHISINSKKIYFYDWSWDITTTSSINRWFTNLESITHTVNGHTTTSILDEALPNMKYKLSYIDDEISDMSSDELVDAASVGRNPVKMAQERTRKELSEKDRRSLSLRRYQRPLMYAEELEDDESGRERMFASELEDTTGRDMFFNFFRRQTNRDQTWI